ncbi:Methyltransferase protein 23 [Phytophthora nicotianae]|uniref:Methyltransferase protein 23 n=1 Tax=Phytophthora nicotianae TaxID=4792 RepID=A0A0W8D3C8_PHYNI|nr:Methyltransferase protein 23 [Phytophthora nicotianae]
MLGAVVGSLVGGVVADWIGRKPANLITAVLFLSGSLFMTFAGSLKTMLVGRFIAGLAVGSSGPCVSTYVAEIAQPKTRGALVTISEKYRTKEASTVLKRLLYSEEASQEIIKAHLDVGLWMLVQTFHESFFHAMSELVTDDLTRKVDVWDLLIKTLLFLLLGFTVVIALLLDHGAKVNTRDVGGNTPLHLAISEGYEDIARFLLENGANPNAKNNDEERCTDLAKPAFRAEIQMLTSKKKGASHP